MYEKKIVLILFVLCVVLVLFIFLSVNLTKNQKEQLISECKSSDNHLCFEDSFMTLITEGEDCCYYNLVEYVKGTDRKYENIISTKIVKMKDKKIISSFDLSYFKDNNDEWYFVERGVIQNGFLYFIVDNSIFDKNHNYFNSGNHPIFRIDTNLNNIETYIDSSEYGNILKSTLSIYNNNIVYITDKKSIVEFDGQNETEIINVDKFSDELNTGATYKTDSYIESVWYVSPLGCHPLYVQDNHFTVVVTDNKIYCGFGYKLFAIKDQKRISEIPLTKGLLFRRSTVKNVEIYNNDLLKVTTCYPSYNNKFTLLYIINPTTKIEKQFYSEGELKFFEKFKVLTNN